jgi:outer membrane protein OmpA-like peptidoglycan-associated protein
MTSNYTGISGVFSQPASTADNRLKVDVLLVAENNSVGNNYLLIDPYVLRKTKNVINSDEDFQSKYVTESAYNGKPKYVFARFDAMGPSAMVMLSPKHAFGVFSRSRVFMNLDNIEDSLARNIYNNFTDQNFWQSMHSDDNISMQIHGWSEIGLNYARVLYDNKTHFVKGGLNVKYLRGLGSGYIFIKDFQFSLQNEDYIDVFKTDVNYGHSDNINTEDLDKLISSYKISSAASVGFDFGLVYEYRPDYREFFRDLDGKKNVPLKDKNKYLFKVGISVTDIGSIKYQKSPLSYDFHADVKNLSLDTFGTFGSIVEFDSFIQSMFVYDQSDSNSKYRMGLPTTISLQLDYHVYKNVYLNFTPAFSLKSGTGDINKTHYFSTYTLTPRWENKWFGVYNPISYDKVMGFNLGLALRLGPLILGTSNLLLPYFANMDFSGANAYFMLKVPIPYASRKDADKDGVSDKLDLCINLPGTWDSRGCPDIDGDGIADIYDDCPQIKGEPEFRGCPDTDRDKIPDHKDICPYDSGSILFSGCPDIDGDSIIDIKDSCPEIKGPAKYNGCPDADGDGIIDEKDSCPDMIGLLMFNGCPDTDFDGVMDKIDDCPKDFGLKQLKGCPDKDNDFVPDKIDKCPNVPGLIKYNGCPDTDGDGVVDSLDECMNDPGLLKFNGCPDRDMDEVPDKNDKCPDTYGMVENQGCPLVKVDEKEQLAKLTIEEQEIVKTAFEDLEFETGKSVILSRSYPSLDTLAQVLTKKPEFRLSVSGHTDNVGKAPDNQKLSENRAKAVKDYIVKKGVDPARIKTIGYGSKRPVAPNTTPEGRQKNRRVELKIIK